MTGGWLLTDQLRAALYEQLLASNTTKQDLSKSSFEKVEELNGVASPTWKVRSGY
jgi:hypothetical protein